jgi:hypothetical protein
MTRAGKILEYISNPLIWFKNYLTMTDDEKADDISYSHSYEYENYAQEKGIEDGKEFDDLSKEERIKFGKWVFDNNRFDSPDDPSYMFMDFDEITHNTWMVHKSNNVSDIIAQGFKYGLEDFDRLGLTTYYKNSAKLIRDPLSAYVFAFADDNLRPAEGDHYGRDAVMFRASGVTVRHHGDEEYQTVFVAGTATDFVPIWWNGSGWEVQDKRTDRVLHTEDRLADVVFWVENNFSQYRKVLVQRERN